MSTGYQALGLLPSLAMGFLPENRGAVRHVLGVRMPGTGTRRSLGRGGGAHGKVRAIPEKRMQKEPERELEAKCVRNQREVAGLEGGAGAG